MQMSPVLSEAAQRFAAKLHAPEAITGKLARSCAVRVSAGLHRGALIRLKKTSTVGSLDNNDIVLRDPEILDQHAELRRVNDVWALFSNPAGVAINAFETVRSGRCVRKRYVIGTAQIVVTQVAPAVLGKFQILAKPLTKLLAPLLLGTAAVLASVVVVYMIQPASANVISGTRSLAQEGWPDVELVSGKAGLIVRGYVNDPAVFKRLKHWLNAQNFTNASIEVRVGTEVLARVRDALADSSVSADYVGAGTVRIQGSSDKPALIERIKQIGSDLQEVVRIDNRVAFYRVPDVGPKQHILPFRIVDIQHETRENTGSFSADNNARYFVGAVLPDGSEVLAIRSDRIEFLSGDRLITYLLK